MIAFSSPRPEDGGSYRYGVNGVAESLCCLLTCC
jgi:hypothetical protein